MKTTEPDVCGVVRFSQKEKAYVGCEGRLIEVGSPIESRTKPFCTGHFLRERVCNVCGLKYSPKESEE